MGIDIASVAGIGFDAEELLSEHSNNSIAISYDKFKEDENFIYEVEDSIGSLLKYGYFEATAADIDDNKVFLLASDPIKGVQLFLDELNSLGIPVTIDDLEFISEPYLW